MAINPPSDIILDVARAADPLQYSAAVQKLARIGHSEAAGASFELLLGEPSGAELGAEPQIGQQADAALDWARSDLRSRLAPMGAQASAVSSAQPYRQFEAFVLQTFIESMLPKDANHVFGDGIAGSYWGSMLAEQIAGQVAKSGGIGIAAELAKVHPATPDDNSKDGIRLSRWSSSISGAPLLTRDG